MLIQKLNAYNIQFYGKKKTLDTTVALQFMEIQVARSMLDSWVTIMYERARKTCTSCWTCSVTSYSFNYWFL